MATSLQPLTNFDEIWHNDAYWSPAPDVKFKLLIFDNLTWRSLSIMLTAMDQKPEKSLKR